MTSLWSQNDKKGELERNRLKTMEEIEFTSKLIEQNKQKSNKSTNELYLVNHKINKQNELISGLENEINLLDIQISENTESVKEIEYRQEKIKKNYAHSIYLTYKKRPKVSFILYILASENLNVAYKRFRYIQLINNYRKRQVGILLDNKSLLINANKRLKNSKDEKATMQQMHETEYNKLKNTKIQQSSIITELKKKDKELKNELEKKKRIAGDLEREIEKIINEERKKSIKGDIYATLTKEEKLISDEFGRNYGKLPWPTKQGIVIGKFGEHEHPSMKGIKVRNDGIYIATVKDAEIRSIFNGVVTKIFSIPGANYTLIIKHGNYYSLYHNLIDLKVSIGSIVKTKDVLGKVAADMDKNENILYFQIWKETERNDPELWLSH
jgi:murein hydrolase activator